MYVYTMKDFSKYVKERTIHSCTSTYPRRCFERNIKKREMVSSWQLLIGLFALLANSLQHLNVVHSRRNDKAAWDWTLDNDDSNANRFALPTTTGPNEIAQQAPPGGGGDVMRSDISISNGSGGGGGGCASNNKGLSRRIRARDEKSCVENFLPFSSSGEEEEIGPRQQLLPIKPPNAQQGGGGGGQNSGGDGSGDERKFRVVLPRTHDLLQFLFIPRENRPTRDSEVCPDPSRPFPICGRPGDAYITSNPIAPGLVVDPAYLCTLSLPLLLLDYLYFYYYLFIFIFIFIFFHIITLLIFTKKNFVFIKQRECPDHE